MHRKTPDMHHAVIQIRPIHYQDADWYAVKIPKHPLEIQKIRQVPGRKWVPEKKVWLVPQNEANRAHLATLFPSAAPPAPRSDGNKAEGDVPVGLRRMQGRSYLMVYTRLHQPESIALVKQIQGRRWVPEQKAWSLPYSLDKFNHLKYLFRGRLSLQFDPEKQPPPDTRKASPTELKAWNGALEAVQEKMILKRMSRHTLKSYCSLLDTLFGHFATTPPEELTLEQVRQFLLLRIRRDKISESYQNQLINAAKFYFEQVLGRPRENLYLERPKKGEKLPNVLSEEAVSRILKAPTNLKHRCILVVVYSAGLRLSEVIQLRVMDVQFDQKRLFIHGGKGKKDRYTLLAKKTTTLVRQYLQEYQPAYWLFEGPDGGQYGRTSVQKIFRRAVKKAGANPLATLHWLRHSFATHLVEKGISLRHVQVLLGHNSLKTTEIYTHVARINHLESPLDRMDI